MAHHLIFIENAPGRAFDKTERFRECGLDDHFKGCDALGMSADESPTGSPGMMFAWRKVGDDQIICDKEKQIWRKSPAGYHVGIWRDRPPAERDLRRDYTQNGVWIELGGEKWKFPTPSLIDKRLALSDNGQWEYQPLRDLAWYSDEIEKRQSDIEFSDDGNATIRFVDLEVVNIVVRALRINYRITPEVCDMLEFFTSRSISACFQAMIGMKFDSVEAVG